jgi:3-hydroxy-3-methylglutaryl CoA synthase
VESKLDELAIEVKAVITNQKDISIDIQKNNFYDRDQPDIERLFGGLKYVYLGGNGDIKNFVTQFAGQHPDIYKTITRLKPELKLKP